MKKMLSLALVLGLLCSFGGAFAAGANATLGTIPAAYEDGIMPLYEPCTCGGWFKETVTYTGWDWTETRKCACSNPDPHAMDYRWQREKVTTSRCTNCGLTGDYTLREWYGSNGWKHGSSRPA